MPTFHTVNPQNDGVIKTYTTMDQGEVLRRLAASQTAFRAWRHTPVADRTACLLRLAALLEGEAARLGALATAEMGKPMKQAVKEAEKCALACRYYAEHAPALLADEPVVTSFRKSYVAYRPLGPILCIMPWNFPYWQVIRVAAPALAAGNTILLKHAENTTGVALEIESLCLKAGFPPHAFQTLLLDHDGLKGVIAADEIQGVSLTGSERAGSAVAAAAGAALKKTVLELGGSDAYVVLRDADVDQAASLCVEARLVNSGQSCIAAKRFIVEAPVHDAFVEAFVAKARAKRVGDPRDGATDVGPLAKRAIVDSVASQVQESLRLGARALLGGTRPGGPGCYYPVTVLSDVAPGMPAFDEEVFGPVAAIIRAADAEAALYLANLSRYGLGGAIFSRDLARAERLAADHLEAGFTVVNGMVASDVRLPFGGVKSSGYGRELGAFGLREFLNIKTVVVNS